MQRLLAAILLILVVASCGSGDETPSEITGTVVEVNSQGLTDVESFVVSEDDQRYTILIDDTTNLGFPPTHLNEHRISGQPVKVEVDERNGDLFATSIVDG